VLIGRTTHDLTLEHACEMLRFQTLNKSYAPLKLLPTKGLFGNKVFQTTIFKCHDITMVYQGIFYINPTNTCLETKYSKPWYLVDICKKLVIAMKTLCWSRVSNTSKISWYLANYGIQNRIFTC
jgi:hypothetical protein